MTSERIVAVDLLTEEDGAVLGKGFERLFPLPYDGVFDELLAKLDNVKPVAQRSPIKPRR